MGANSQLFDVITEAELTEVLSHYDTEYVLAVVDNAMKNRFTTANTAIKQPNVVAAWEQNFKQLMSYYQDNEFIAKIKVVREETYKEIIGRICQEFGLNFTIDDSIDYYSAAFYLYDFFVAGFDIYLAKFLGNFIFRERSGIYESMNLAALKKNKDSSTTYGKRIYKDIKLAVINANIDLVVSNVLGADIPFDVILINTLPKEQANYIVTLVSPSGDFYKDFYGTVMSSAIRPVILTEIRFVLQELATSHDVVYKDDEAIAEQE